MREISVLTNQLTSNASLESWFIQNTVLQGLSFNLEWDIGRLWNGVVVYLEIGTIDLQTINTLKDQGNKVILFQLGDEILEKYNKVAYEQCDSILRNYYFPEVFDEPLIAEKIYWIPNGYKSGVGPRNHLQLRSADRRHFLSSFLGWLNNTASHGNERAFFASIAMQCQSDILLQPTASFGQGFNPGLYSAVLEHSVFCLCPAGNSPETIRLYDALELGCIPISLKHAFLSNKKAFINPPFPLLDSWEQLPQFLKQQREQIATDPTKVLHLQNACIEWWHNHKLGIATTISSLFYELRSIPQ